MKKVQLTELTPWSEKLQSIQNRMFDEADRQDAMTDDRLLHESVFRNVRSAIHGK